MSRKFRSHLSPALPTPNHFNHWRYRILRKYRRDYTARWGPKHSVDGLGILSTKQAVMAFQTWSSTSNFLDLCLARSRPIHHEPCLVPAGRGCHRNPHRIDQAHRFDGSSPRTRPHNKSVPVKNEINDGNYTDEDGCRFDEPPRRTARVSGESRKEQSRKNALPTQELQNTAESPRDCAIASLPRHSRTQRTLYEAGPSNKRKMGLIS